MTTHLRLSHVLPLIAALALPACATSEPDTSEADAELAAPVWSPALHLTSTTIQAAQIATLNGVTYTVTAGTCGSGDCLWGYNTTQLRWNQRNSDGTWSAQRDIDGQATNSKVSLAAFNGYLYMVHTGEDDSSATWISRFNPVSQTWSDNYQISYPSFAGPPAIVAFNNKLYFIGTSSTSPYQMWYGTMDTNESFTSRVNIPGHTSAGRASATVAYGKLWFSHRWGQTGDVVYGTFDGTTWTAPTHIYGGMNNGAIQAYESAIAYDQYTVHLIHRRPGEQDVWWTYFDGCKWATSEVTLPNQPSLLEPSLAQGAPGILQIGESEFDDLFGFDHYTLDFRGRGHSVIATPPVCNVGSSPR